MGRIYKTIKREKSNQMKYIKLYEDHNEYYYQILHNDVDTDRYRLFDINSLKKIKKFFLDNKIKAYIHHNHIGHTLRTGTTRINLDNYLVDKNSSVESISFKKFNKNINISYFGDEWYLVKLEISKDNRLPINSFQGLSVKHSVEWYMCDQLDGLIKFINDKKLIDLI